MNTAVKYVTIFTAAFIALPLVISWGMSLENELLFKYDTSFFPKRVYSTEFIPGDRFIKWLINGDK